MSFFFGGRKEVEGKKKKNGHQGPMGNDFYVFLLSFCPSLDEPLAQSEARTRSLPQQQQQRRAHHARAQWQQSKQERKKESIVSSVCHRIKINNPFLHSKTKTPRFFYLP